MIAPNSTEDTAQLIGKNAATLALIEVSIGSAVHSFKIPLGGTLLSLNQSYFLSRLTQETKTHPSNATIPFSVSVIVAMLKSLSPAGNKLAPMLSISMQGFLFSLPLVLLGLSTPVLMLASALSSLWSFVQPILSYYVLFGPDFFLALEALAKKTFPFLNISLEGLLQALLILVIIKAVVAVGLTLLALKKKSLFKVSETASEKLYKKISTTKQQPGSPLVLAFKDLFRPLFVLSFLMTSVFLYFAESQNANLIWKMLRPLALAFLFFYISRTLLISKLFEKLENTRLDFLHRAYQNALLRLTEASKKAI